MAASRLPGTYVDAVALLHHHQGHDTEPRRKARVGQREAVSTGGCGPADLSPGPPSVPLILLVKVTVTESMKCIIFR